MYGAILFIMAGLALFIFSLFLLNECEGGWSIFVVFIAVVCVAAGVYMLSKVTETSAKTYAIEGEVTRDAKNDTLSFMVTKADNGKERITLDTKSNIKEAYEVSKTGETYLSVTFKKRFFGLKLVDKVTLYTPEGLEGEIKHHTSDTKEDALPDEDTPKTDQVYEALEKEHDYLAYLVSTGQRLSEEEFQRVQTYNEKIKEYEDLEPITLN